MARTRTKQNLSDRQRPSRSSTKLISYREPSTDGEEEDAVAQPPRRSNPRRTLRSSSHTRKRKLPIGSASDSQEDSDDALIQITRKKRRVAPQDQSSLELHSGRPQRVLRSSNRTSSQHLIESSDAHDSEDEVLINTRNNNRVTQINRSDAQDSEDDVVLNTHKKSRFTEIDASDVQDSEDEVLINTRNRRNQVTEAGSPSRRFLRSSNSRPKQSDLAYLDSEESQGESQNSEDDVYQQSTRRKRQVSAKARSTRSSPSKKTPSRKTPPSTELVVHSTQDAKIPDWASLPFAILCQIFHYASVPLLDHRFQRFRSPKTDSAKWLLRTALVCRNFTEPCLQVLYRCPPLVTTYNAHQLVQHLKADQSSMSMNYRAKVESIQFEADTVASRVLSGHGLLDLRGLIQSCTRLKDLEIYHEKDFQPYEDLEHSIRWSYPDSLFDALDEEWTEKVEELDRTTNTMVTTLRQRGPVKLQSWRWNERLAGEKQEPRELRALHLTPKFHDLQKVAFVHYRPTDINRARQESKEAFEKRVELLFSEKAGFLADAIQELPKLRHLVLESCTLVTGELLLKLPSSLRVLEITNCEKLEAEDLGKFLATKGQHLEELLLSHNEALTLSFLPELSKACRLEVLRVTLHHDPLYEEMIRDTEVPSWPSTLRVMEINKVYHWKPAALEMFFKSIVDNAANLSHLRRLIVNCSISLSWRNRVAVREKWEGVMQKVFRSRLPLPNPSWTSIKAMQSQQEGGVESDLGQVEGISAEKVDELDLSGLSVAPISLRSQPDDDDDSLPLDRSKRTTRSTIKYTESSDDEDEPVPPSTPQYTNGYGELASPPSTAGRAKADDDYDEPSLPSTYPRKMKLSRELAALHATAGQDRLRADLLPSSPAPTADADSDEEGSQNRSRSTSEHVEPFIQGMCEKVDITIGNLRFRQDYKKEEDFMDGEQNDSDDGDWNGRDIQPDEDGDRIVF